MRKIFTHFVLSIVAMNFLNVVYGNEFNQPNSQLMPTPYQEENSISQKERDIQSEKIYIEPHHVLIFNNQIFTYLNECWQLVTGLYTDEAGLYILGKGYHPNCPPNFQKPVCLNKHPAIYKVHTPKGEFYRFLCEYHGCDYQYHTYIKKYLPPGYYVLGIHNH